jgi:hypothetical protein
MATNQRPSSDLLASDIRKQLICLWSGAAFLPLYGIGFVLFAGFIPIPSPTLTGLEVTAMFEENQLRILIGMGLCAIASALLGPWSAAIFSQMWRAERGFRIFSGLQLAGGVMGVVFFITPCFIWSAMAFRTGHDPDTMLILNDFAWIAWIISWPPYVLQFMSVALCILTNKSEGAQQVFPRWLAYLSVFLTIDLFNASLIVFFKTGPFALNGLISVYIPVGLYAVWFVSMFFVLRKAIKSQADPVPVLRAGAVAA